MNAAVVPQPPAIPATAPILIYPTVELALAVETDAYPKTDFHSIQLHGPIDIPAFVEAFDEAVFTYPVAQCRLEERRIGLSRRLYWVPTGRRNKLTVDDCRDRVKPPVDGVAFAAEYFREGSLHRIDLFREPPMRFFLLRLADDVTLFSTLHQHIAVDAAGVYGFFRDILARYHEKVKGEKPAWLEAAATNTARSAVVVIRPRSVRTAFAEYATSLIKGRRSVVSMIATAQTRPILGRNMNRGVFESETLREIKNYCKRHDATLVDALLAAIFRTIGAWDREHGQERQDRINTLLAVNARHRIAGLKDQSFGMSGIPFLVRRPEDIPFDVLVEWFRDERKRQLDVGVDVSLMKLLSTVFRAAGALPVRMRAPIIRALSGFSTTFVLSNIGIMWPEVRDGKLTGRSAFTRVGDFELDDNHACPSLTPHVAMGIVTRTLGDRLFINYTTDQARFLPEEATELTSRITRAIRALDRIA
jgi:NRPS condensation-like uncharacterized protein